MLRRLVLLIGGLALSVSALAAEVGGVKLEDKEYGRRPGARPQRRRHPHQGVLQGLRREPVPAGEGEGPRRRAGQGAAPDPDEPAAQPVRRPARRRAASTGSKENNTPAELAAVKPQTDELVAIMKTFGEVKEGNVVTIDFVDGATRSASTAPPRARSRGEPFNKRAHADLARRQAGPGRSQEGDARRLTAGPTGERPPAGASPARGIVVAPPPGARRFDVPDFWTSCGYRLLARRRRPAGADRRFPALDAARPELAPVAESCAAELALHDRLIAAPRAAVDRSGARGASSTPTRARTTRSGCASGTGSWPRRRSRRPMSRCFATVSTCRRCSSAS